MPVLFRQFVPINLQPLTGVRRGRANEECPRAFHRSVRAACFIDDDVLAEPARCGVGEGMRRAARCKSPARVSPVCSQSERETCLRGHSKWPDSFNVY